MSQKPKLQFSVPCLGYEEPNDIPCLLYLFYDLPFGELPAPLEFRVCNGWCMGQGRFEQSVQVLDPDKNVLLDTQAREFTLESTTKPFLSVFQFQLVVEKQGSHWIRVNLGGEVVMEYPFTVRLGEKKGDVGQPMAASAAPVPTAPGPFSPQPSLDSPKTLDQPFLMP